MICNKDAGGGKAFWTAVMASRVVLPNGAEAEVIDLTDHLSFCAGNVVKYVCRAGRKDPGKHVEDLKKARWYIDREIEKVKGH